MSSVANIATAAMASNQAQVQMAVAAKFAKMNQSSEQSMVALIEASAENMKDAAKAVLAPGVGENLDISV